MYSFCKLSFHLLANNFEAASIFAVALAPLKDPCATDLDYNYTMS